MSTSQGRCSSRTISLLCPSLSKLVPLVALEDHGLDIGTIARTFGIDPSTVRLNGHFVSRGVDLISSVTWKSLLSFFAKRGFSTGDTARDAVIVDGKFRDDSRRGSSIGDVVNVAEEEYQSPESSGLGFKRKPHLDSFNLLKKRKVVLRNEGEKPQLPLATSGPTIGLNYVEGSLKRRQFELALTSSPCKRSR